MVRFIQKVHHQFTIFVMKRLVGVNTFGFMMTRQTFYYHVEWIDVYVSSWGDFTQYYLAVLISSLKTLKRGITQKDKSYNCKTLYMNCFYNDITTF